MFDYTFLRESVSWKNWMDIVEVQTSWPASTAVDSVVVQTQDYVRYAPRRRRFVGQTDA